MSNTRRDYMNAAEAPEICELMEQIEVTVDALAESYARNRELFDAVRSLSNDIDRLQATIPDPQKR